MYRVYVQYVTWAFLENVHSDEITRESGKMREKERKRGRKKKR